MIFYGWRIVGAAFLVLFVAYGTQYSFGIFFAALLDEFHWSRAGLSGVFSLYAFAYCVFGFPAGRLTDRWGPRRVITAGGLVLGAALTGMAFVNRLWQPYVLYGGVAALGMGTAYVPCNSTVVKWFARKRGLAVGLATTGGSVGTFALPPLAQWLTSRIGWRAAYVVFGVAVAVGLALVARAMRRDPESLGLHPDGDPAPFGMAPDVGRGMTLTMAIRTSPFWLLGAAFTATWIPVFIPLVHLVPLTRDLGHGPQVGPWTISTLGAGAVVGRLIMGQLSDRIGRTPTIAAAMGLQVLAFLAFAEARTLPAFLVTALGFGYSYGSISTLFPAVVGDTFGRAHAGALVGFLFALAGSMAAWGPLGAGAIYDATGAYTHAFRLAAAFNVLAVVLLLLARRARDRHPSATVARAV